MNTSMRVLICGGRNYKNIRRVSRILDGLDPRPTLIIEGGASGADACASECAFRNRVPNTTFPANWAKHGRAAGPIRNQEMIEAGRPDLVVAFPGGVGTADMVRRARSACVRVIEIDHTSAFSGDRAPAVLPAGEPQP